MIKKKICMLGSFGVGKTSLVQRFVKSIFSEKYLTTIGVKIDQKTVQLKNQEVNLIIWDIHGEDEFQKIKSSYLMGSSGVFLVIDGTRSNTIDTAEYLLDLVEKSIGKQPFIVLVNKCDLKEEWELSNEDMDKLETERSWQIIKTSAKTGEGVEEAFKLLTDKMIGTGFDEVSR